MQTILLATDFSPVAHNTAAYAAQLAKTLQAKLLLFHAYMMPTPVSELPYVMVTADELQKENEQLIKKEAAQLHETYGIEAEWIVRIGIPSDEIRVLTQEREIDLVVMGMKGAGGLDKIIGSTTTNVVRKIKTPVLIIPHEAGYKPLKNITYASDFSYKTSFHLFDPLLQLIKTYQSKLHILNVQKDAEGGKAAELMGKKDIEQIFQGMTHEFTTIAAGAVMPGINEYIRQHDSELLVMVAHKHTFFERVFSKDHTLAMTHETEVPMLVLQDKG